MVLRPVIYLFNCRLKVWPQLGPRKTPIWGGGGLQRKKYQKKPKKKTSPKFEICGSVRFFSVFFGILRLFSVFCGTFSVFSVFCGTFSVFSVFCGTFSVFFGLNFDKKFQSFKNHVNNEVLGGQELPNNIPNAYKALQMSYKSYY